MLPDAVLRYADHDQAVIDVHLPEGVTIPDSTAHMSRLDGAFSPTRRVVAPVALSRGLVGRHPWITLHEVPGGHFEPIEPGSAAWPTVLCARVPLSPDPPMNLVG